jgi:hypothetical protein
MSVTFTTQMGEFAGQCDDADAVEMAAEIMSVSGRIAAIEDCPWLPRVRAKRILLRAVARSAPEGARMIVQESERGVSAAWLASPSEEVQS